MAQVDIGNLVLKLGGATYAWSRKNSKRKESLGEWRGKVANQIRLDCEQLINAISVDGGLLKPGKSSWGILLKILNIGSEHLIKVNSIVNVEGENVYFINDVLTLGITARY